MRNFINKKQETKKEQNKSLMRFIHFNQIIKEIKLMNSKNKRLQIE